MNVIELLQGQLDGNLIHQLTNQIGAESPEQTEAAANGIISTLVAGLNKNAATPEGANALVSAIDRDHDGSLLEDVAGFVFGNRQVSNASTLNGAGILGHILGGKQSGAVDMISKATGLDSGQIMKLMISLAPMVLAALGKARKQEGVGTQNISDLLSGSVRSQVNKNSEMGLLTRFLDADGDGSVMDDIANMGMKLFLNKK
ncbi:MAG TPA: DUF937 domain-containing protein [Saprospiraceae bacterium]